MHVRACVCVCGKARRRRRSGRRREHGMAVSWRALLCIARVGRNDLGMPSRDATSTRTTLFGDDT